MSLRVKRSGTRQSQKDESRYAFANAKCTQRKGKTGGIAYQSYIALAADLNKI